MSLIQMSVLGTVMITVTVIIRTLALNKLPKMTFCILWWIVLVRLLVPYSLPCELSVYSMLTPHNQMSEAAVTNISPIMYNIGSVNAASFTASPESVSSETTPFIGIKTVVWIVGMLGTGAYFALSYYFCRKRFAESLPAENDFLRSWLKEHRILRPLSIRVYDRISSPLTYGLFRPVILMPKETDWNDTNILKYVLTHEYVHIRRCDTVFKLMLTLSLCVHWFNPLVWVMYIIANRDIELSCDEKVVRMLGSEKSSYAMALIQTEEQKIRSFPFSSSFSKNALKERITAIMKFTKITPIAAAAAAFLVTGTTVVFATNTAPDTTNDNSLNAGTMSGDELLPSDKTVNSPNVEWWTYDEYAEWLEQEKANLESMIGQKAWTNTRGDFVWNREIVDETVALYEKILQDIKNGALISKTVDGSSDIMLASGISESPATSFDFEEYTEFGLLWDKEANVLYYKGQRVRYFFDGADMGDDGIAIKLEYADSEKQGDIDVHTVRERIDNGDGSYDPMGPLTGLATYSEEEFNARKFIPSILSAVTYGDAVSEDNGVYLAEYLTGNMASEYGYVPSDTILQEAAAADGTGGGRTFEKIFSKYKPYGISYVEAPDASGAGNVYYNGELVHVFSDVTPSGSAFSFTSSKQGGINIRTVYQNGELSGVEAVTE